MDEVANHLEEYEAHQVLKHLDKELKNLSDKEAAKLLVEAVKLEDELRRHEEEEKLAAELKAQKLVEEAEAEALRLRLEEEAR